ncbi:MAG: S41 family peptidase [Bacillota bacterium]
MKNFVAVLLLLVALFFTSCGEYNGESIDAASIGQTIHEKEWDFLKEHIDFYSSYFTEEEFSLLLDDYMGSYAGIGVYITKNPEDKYVTFLATMPELPAFQAGIEAGDVLLSINGEDLAGVDMDVVATKLRGKEGSTVNLQVFRPTTNKNIKLTLKRKIIESSSVRGQFIENQDGIAYIYIIDFTQKTADEFLKTYNNLKSQGQIKSLIIDLRNNGGGSLSAALKIAGYFVPEGQILMYERLKEGTKESYSKGGAQLQLPLICLQNGNTASASEVFIGALKDYNLAQTVGEQSFGKGITQLIYQMSDGTALRFTKSRYLTPSKYDLHEKGIVPDYMVKMEGENILRRILDVDASHDPQLAKAISLLK